MGNVAREAGPDIKFEVQHWLRFVEAFERRFEAESFARPCVEPAGDGVALLLTEARQSATGKAGREHPLSEDEQAAVDAWLTQKYPPLPPKEDPHPKGHSLFDDLPRVN